MAVTGWTSAQECLMEGQTATYEEGRVICASSVQFFGVAPALRRGRAVMMEGRGVTGGQIDMGSWMDGWMVRKNMDMAGTWGPLPHFPWRGEGGLARSHRISSRASIAASQVPTGLDWTGEVSSDSQTCLLGAGGSHAQSARQWTWRLSARCTPTKERFWVLRGEGRCAPTATNSHRRTTHSPGGR